jgi:hypothetical protein
MGKKKKTKKEEPELQPLEEPKILTDEDRLKAVEKMNELSGSEVITLPDEAIVNIPISGFFKKSVEGVMFYLLEDLKATEIIRVMDKIKTGFKDADPEKITDRDRALWCIMTLLSEIHWQSDAQGKNVVTKQTVGNSIASFISGVKGSTEQISKKVEEINEAKKKSNED